MRVACKIIINGLTGAISNSLEKILSGPLVRGEMMSADKCDELLDELAAIDLRSVTTTPQDSARSVLHIVSDLVDLDVIDPKIWTILAKPADC